MDRKAFKQRMQNLKSYRDNNPGKGYWDWRNSLPDNLKYTDDTEYDMYRAYKSGVQPEYIEEDNSYHLPTRDPNTGKILKKSIHPTFWKGLTEDAKLGYDAYFVGDEVYTKNKYEGPIQAFADGGEIPPSRKTGAWSNERGEEGIVTTDSNLPEVNIYGNDPKRLQGQETPLMYSNNPETGELSITRGYVPSAGYVSNYDPIMSTFVEGATLSPVAKVFGKVFSKGYNKFVKPKFAKRNYSYNIDGDDFLARRKQQWEKQWAEQQRIIANSKKTIEQFDNQLEDTYNSIIDNEEAFRRAATIDRKYNTNYVKTYSNQLKNYNDKSDKAIKMVYDSNMKPNGRAYVDRVYDNEIKINRSYPYHGEPLPEGLVTHEVGHTVDLKAGDMFIKKLGDRNKFISDDKLRQMYPSDKSFDHVRNYLMDGTEIKSHMNEFRNFLRGRGEWSDKETVNSFMKKLYRPDVVKQFRNLKMLFDAYKNKSQFVKDYNTIPIVSTSPSLINSYFNDNRNYEEV